MIFQPGVGELVQQPDRKKMVEVLSLLVLFSGAYREEGCWRIPASCHQ
jgi:hypothetical protein